MDNKLLYFDPENLTSWLFDRALCKELQDIKEQNYKELLNKTSLIIDTDLIKFLDLNIKLQDYSYNRLSNKFENLESGIWKSDLNLAYTQSYVANKLLNSQILNNFTNNIDLFVKTFWNDSLVIFIPANTYIKSPISLNNENFLDTKQLLVKKVVIIVEENSRVELEENIKYQDNLSIESISIIAGKNSIVKFIKNHNNTNGYSINNINCYLNRDARVDILDCSYNSSFYLNYINLILKDTGAQASYTNLSNISNANTQAIITNQVHEASYTESKVLVKSLLQNQGQSFYKGLINIDKQAGNSNSDQKNLNLILDSTVKTCSIPALEVKNNNVKCSHGSAMGKLDKEQLWYLNSRGLENEQSKNFLVEGFFRDISTSAFKEQISKLIKYLI